MLIGYQTILGGNADSGELVAHQSVHNFIQLDNAVAGLTVAEVRICLLYTSVLIAFIVELGEVAVEPHVPIAHKAARALGRCV